MRVVALQGGFGLDNLSSSERPEPEPGRGEVKLRLRAASLNYRDWLMVQGLYNPRQPLPLIPCSDGVGEIVAVGEGVESLTPGQRVATLFVQGWIAGEPPPDTTRRTLGGPLDGTLAESMVLPADGVCPVPDHLEDVEAATLTCAGLTAWSALVSQANIRAGDRVLLLGTGGVSLFALQFARLLGAEVVITSGSDEKLERAMTLGASAGFNYRSLPDWGKAVKQWTGGRGVDLVVEVGGSDTLPQSLRAVRPGGQISLVGNLTGGRLELDLVPIFMRHIRLQGILVGHRQGFEAMTRAIASHSMRPVVDRAFPLDEAPRAFAAFAEERHFGKICLQFDV